jgi:hypothetical protein
MMGAVVILVKNILLYTSAFFFCLSLLFTTLSVSGLSGVDDRVINEYGALGGICGTMRLASKVLRRRN